MRDALKVDPNLRAALGRNSLAKMPLDRRATASVEALAGYDKYLKELRALPGDKVEAGTGVTALARFLTLLFVAAGGGALQKGKISEDK